MATRVKKLRILHGICGVLFLFIFLLPSGCGESSGDAKSETDLNAFKEMARLADCADLVNRLFLIDGQMVFWDRRGTCADNSFAQTLFGATVDAIFCMTFDSIAGPVTLYRNDFYRDMFDTIIANLDAPDLGLGPGHTVVPIFFE